MCSLSERRGEAGTARLARPRGWTGFGWMGRFWGGCLRPADPISVSPGRGYPAPGSDTAKAESQEVLPVGIPHDLGTCRKSSQGLAFVLGPKSQTQGKWLVLSQISNFLVFFCLFACLLDWLILFFFYSDSKMKHYELTWNKSPLQIKYIFSLLGFLFTPMTWSVLEEKQS